MAVGVTIQYDGTVWTLYASIPSGFSPTTLDSLTFTGQVSGYSSGGCSSFTSTQSFTVTLNAAQTSAFTVLSVDPDWLSTSPTAFTVEGQTITSSPQSIVVNGHTYIITGLNNCFNP
jgi:hypothetical protein